MRPGIIILATVDWVGEIQALFSRLTVILCPYSGGVGDQGCYLSRSYRLSTQPTANSYLLRREASGGTPQGEEVRCQPPKCPL